MQRLVNARHGHTPHLHLDGLSAHADVHVDEDHPVLLRLIGKDEGSTVLAEVYPSRGLLRHRVAHLHAHTVTSEVIRDARTHMHTRSPKVCECVLSVYHVDVCCWSRDVIPPHSNVVGRRSRSCKGEQAEKDTDQGGCHSCVSRIRVT